MIQDQPHRFPALKFIQVKVVIKGFQSRGGRKRLREWSAELRKVGLTSLVDEGKGRWESEWKEN
jgi:hypothetical protein